MLAPLMAIIPSLIFSSRVMSHEVGVVAFLRNELTHDWRSMVLGEIQKRRNSSQFKTWRLDYSPASCQLSNIDSEYGLQMTSDAFRQEKHPHIPARSVLAEITLGGSDGAIEGLATTAALNGAGVGFGTIEVAGMAFAVAGAISMFFSYYLSTRAELESLKTDISRESMEIETEPDEETREMNELLKKDGYDESEVQVIMARLQKDKGLWLREMLRRELGLNALEVKAVPFSRPASAGLAFLLLALLAVSPYTLGLARITTLVASLTLSLIALFTLGSRAFVPRHFRLLAGIESAGVGAAAGGLLYLVGILFSRL